MSDLVWPTTDVPADATELAPAPALAPNGAPAWPPGTVTLEAFRRALGPVADGKSDEDIRQLQESMRRFARSIVRIWMQQPDPTPGTTDHHDSRERMQR